MEFFCVLSVGGSLASYQVQKESEATYKAVLRMVNGKRDDIPVEITLQKEGDNWKAQPHHDEIVRSLVLAIETNEH